MASTNEALREVGFLPKGLCPCLSALFAACAYFESRVSKFNGLSTKSMCLYTKSISMYGNNGSL